MKKLFLLMLLSVVGIMHSFDKMTPPFDKNGIPDAVISELLNIAGIKQDGTAPDIVKKTQEEWIRKPGTERWEIDAQDKKYHEALRAWLEAHDFVKEIKPQEKEYKYMIILGGIAPRVKNRVLKAQELLKAGLICTKIIIICGERPLDEKVEAFDLYATEEDAKNKKFEAPTTETAMMKYVVDHSELDKNNIEWYSVPMIETGSGQKRRPTTGDTVNLWLASHPQAGSCLFISMQPHAHYQDAVVRNLMPDGFTVETVAPESNVVISDGDHLDNLARWLYQEWENRKKQK